MIKRAILTGLAALLFAHGALAQDRPPEIQAGFVDGFGGGAGSVVLTQTRSGLLVRIDLLVRIEVTGLPEGWHAVAFHAIGNCSDTIDGFQLAGLPLANAGEEHGYLNLKGPKAGALPNIWVHGDRTGRAMFYTSAVTLDTLRDQDGSALVLYAGPDDYATQPAGNSGARIACAVIPAA